MRQQSKRIRGRGRGGNNGGGGGGGGGKGPNPLTRSYESNGPDVKIRGTAGTIADKYVQLSRDALSAGDPVSAENYMQHAEHYYRLLAAAQAQYQPHQTFVRADAEDFNDVDFDDDGEGGEAGAQQANGQPAAQAGGQGAPQNGQPHQQNGRQNNNGRPNGYNGQQPRDGERRFDRNDRNDRDRRPYDQNRQDGGRRDDRQDNRQDNRQDGGRREDRPYRSERGDQPFEQRADRQPQPERAVQDDQPDVGGLPAFITGGAPAAEAPTPAAAPRPARERRSASAAAAPAPAEAVEEPTAVEPVAAAESSVPETDPRDEDAPAGGRTRRRRYGRFGRGPAAEEGGADPAPAPSDASD